MPTHRFLQTAPAPSAASPTSAAPAANGTAAPAPTAGVASSKDPKQIKADLKNESAYAKVLSQKSKAEGQELKAAIKDGEKATKAEAKVRSRSRFFSSCSFFGDRGWRERVLEIGVEGEDCGLK